MKLTYIIGEFLTDKSADWCSGNCTYVFGRCPIRIMAILIAILLRVLVVFIYVSRLITG
jgi:hypothetical protein